MSCDVCVSQDYDERADFTRETHIQRSRRPIKCHECREVFPARSPYWKIVGKWSGQIITIRECECCYEIQRVFCCDGWVYGELWEGMREQAFEHLAMAGECWDQLSSKSKFFLLKEWNDWKFDK